MTEAVVAGCQTTGKIIEVGGTRKGCRKSTVPAKLTVNLATGRLALPNPHSYIQKHKIEQTHGTILAWLRQRDSQKLEEAINTAEQLLKTHDKIRVQCFGGKHRSQVVAAEVAKRFSNVKTDLLDASELKEEVPAANAVF